MFLLLLKLIINVDKIVIIIIILINQLIGIIWIINSFNEVI